MSDEQGDLDSDLDLGLEAAFGAPEERGASILKRIERLTGVRSRLLLHDPPEEESPLTYVHRLQRDEEGAEDDSRYQIAGEIAKGGVGVIYKGRDRDLGRDVALKVLRRAHAGNPEVFRRFVEEAQIGGQLQHPGIVPVYSLGLQPDGRPSFAMKLVKGRTLAAQLRERSSPADGRRTLLRNFERICQTMAYAHARGVIHRDLKPSNVMLGAFGEVLVVDWGFGKVLGRPEPEKPQVEHTVVTTVRSEEDGSASMAGSVMGTPAYMPPEQALGYVNELDEQTDVFSLGSILCEILTGRPPYVGESKDLLVMASQARLEDALARLDGCDADPEVKALARRCLHPLRADRPANAGEVANEMGWLLSEAEERAQAAEVEAVEARARSKQAQSHAQWERRAKRLTFGLAAAALVAVVAGGALFFHEQAQARDREERVRPQLAQAFEEASRLQGQERWAEALTVARKAKHLAADLGEADRSRATTLVSQTIEQREAAAAEAAQVEKDRLFLAELEEIRLGSLGSDVTQRESDEAYLQAFRDYGIDLEQDDLEQAGAATRARGDEFAGTVASALDVWCRVMDFVEGQPVAREVDLDRLATLARLCCPDEQQNRLRSLIQARDAAGLAEMAASERMEDLSVPVLVLFHHALRALGRAEDALNVLERAERLEPGDPWVHADLARAYRQRDRFEDAERHLVAVLAMRPQSVWAHIALAAHRLNRGERSDGAETLLRRAVEIAPEDADSQFGLGVFLRHRGDVEEAIEALRTAVAIEPDVARQQHELGRALSQLGRWADAVPPLRAAARLDPESALVHDDLGRALGWIGEPEESLAAHRRAAMLAPDRWDVLFNLGIGLFQVGALEQAAEVLQRSMQLDGSHPETAFRLGLARALLQEHRSAEEALREAIRRDPEHAEALSHLGILLNGLGRSREALPYVRRGHEIASGTARWRHPSARMLADVERTIEVLDRLPDVLSGALEPDGYESCRRYSKACRQEGRHREALRLSRRALQLEPSDPMAERYDAACSAVLLGTGSSPQAEGMEGSTRARLRSEARTWLVGVLGMDGANAVSPLLSSLRFGALSDPDFEQVRDPEALAVLPAEEREAWAAFWVRVRALVGKTERGE